MYGTVPSYLASHEMNTCNESKINCTRKDELVYILACCASKLEKLLTKYWTLFQVIQNPTLVHITWKLSNFIKLIATEKTHKNH